MVLPELALVGGAERRLGGLRRVRVEAERELPVHQPHLARVAAHHLLHRVVRRAAVRALEVGELHDGDRRVLGPARRALGRHLRSAAAGRSILRFACFWSSAITCCICACRCWLISAWPMRSFSDSKVASGGNLAAGSSAGRRTAAPAPRWAAGPAPPRRACGCSPARSGRPSPPRP